MVCPGITLVPGVNMRTGWTVEPWLNWSRVMDVKAVIVDGGLVPPGTVVPIAMPGASKPLDKGPPFKDNLKPAGKAAEAAPRVSPVRVMVIAAVPDAAPPVVRTRVVLVAVTCAEVAVKAVTLLAMEETVPKK